MTGFQAVPARAGSATPSPADLAAQIAATERQATAAATQVHQATLSYAQAEATAASLAQQEAAVAADAASLSTGLHQALDALKRDALLSYTGATAAGVILTASPSVSPEVQAEYLRVASGDITDLADSVRLQERQLAADRATLAGQRAAAGRAATQAARARTTALAEAAATQATVDQLQVELRRAQAAAAQQAATQAAASRPATQGPPVADGLVQVVNGLLSSPTPAGSSAAPAQSAKPAVQAPAATPPATPETTSPTTKATTPPTTAAPTTAAPTSQMPVASPAVTTGAAGVWAQLRQCESGGNYATNTGNGYYGAYQFSQSTWTALGFPGRPDQAPPAVQDAAARKLQQEAGWGQWPACAAALGLI